MARGKKKEENLTLEEKLEQALVPEEEWPYEVPGNWCWVKLGYVCNIENGYAFKSDFFSNESGFPVVRISNIVDNEINLEKCVYSTEADISDRFIVQYGDLLIAMSGATTGKNGVYLLKQTSYLNQRVGNIKIINHKLLYREYRNYFIRYIEQNILNSAYGGAQPNISSEKLGTLQIPLPPVPEQQRIINYIEKSFNKLDEVKEKVQIVFEGSENRKAAILHKAFSGKLTEQWRKEQGIEGESWKTQKLSSLGKLERGKSKHRPRNDPSLFGDKYPFIQTGDIAEAQIYIKEHKQSLSELGLKQSRLFPAGTLCITIAANIGNVAILSYDCCFPDSVVGFTPNDETDSKFIYYIMCTMQKKLEAEAPATAQKNINLKVLNDITLNTPSLSEQHEIVKILDELLEKENRVENICENIFTQIDLLKKSILSRAFRGELGTNNPDEKSPIELLKMIL